MLKKLENIPIKISLREKDSEITKIWLMRYNQNQLKIHRINKSKKKLKLL